MSTAPQISGITPLTTIDFPDHLACVVYTQGCPLRCGYCQNPHLIPFESGDGAISWGQVLDFLQQRRGLLEAVVFSGGEPTLQPGLRAAMLTAIELGYKVGLHSAGVSARHLAELLGLLDWVGLDVKAPDHLYPQVTGRTHQPGQNRRCLELLLESSTAFECRTTVDWRLLQPDDLLQLAQQLQQQGVQHYALQINHGGHCLDPRLRQPALIDPGQKALLKARLEGIFPHFEWRE
ncbi:anaerobic ribonucleoside-triphosphate reductase activating protein [Marinobacterium jannaschii]|uniref:anaerobic ribonucleoside-triphosphate reductase activating protein n=1 Tax=Marinobacterium jannaschii TaxID=64970 RepID=UPI0004826CE0|nr:anaerobic ribonucleoside-triphosphate reductase activating protein [Marinobacterium jannaschii]